eukprot:6478843-Amphidinium_carterae.1
MCPQLYGRYNPPNAGFVPNDGFIPPNAGFVPHGPSVLAGNLPGSVNTACCPPGLSPCVDQALHGFQSPHSLSFGPPATCLDHLCAHPCSPSVHDCTRVSGGVMNTFDVAPDPYAA